MTQLLTNDELRMQVANLVFDVFADLNIEQINNIPKKKLQRLYKNTDKLISIINSQKQAYADMIIGELDPTPPTSEWETWSDAKKQFLIGRNNRLEEQRQKNELLGGKK